MKKMILSALALFSVALAGAHIPQCADGSKSNNENVVKYDFKKFKVHIYTSPEAMADVTLLVEGKNGLVVLEPQSFYKSIKDFNAYVEKLGKPILVTVANYHAGGLAECDLNKVVMVESMVEFMKSPAAQGMMKYFADAFQGAMDTRSVEVKNTIPQEGKQKWAGVKFDFTKGAATDMPASSVNIGNKVFYTHFSPNKMHPSPMQITSVAAIDATINELNKAKDSGCKLFIGSHGAAANVEDVKFLISYLEKMKSIKAANKDAASFTKAIKVAYPDLAGAENVEEIANKLYK